MTETHLEHLITKDEITIKTNFPNNEAKIAEAFQIFLCNCSVGKINTFIYKPRFQTAFIVEIGVRGPEGFFKPRYTMLCEGALELSTRTSEIICRNDFFGFRFSKTEEVNTTWLSYILSPERKSFEEIPFQVQTALLCAIPSLPKVYQGEIKADSSSLLKVFQKRIKQCLTNPSVYGSFSLPAITRPVVLLAESVYPFSQKTKIDEEIRAELDLLSDSDFFEYHNHFIKIGPKNEQEAISENTFYKITYMAMQKTQEITKNYFLS